jgi:hypothetical protein
MLDNVAVKAVKVDDYIKWNVDNERIYVYKV